MAKRAEPRQKSLTREFLIRELSLFEKRLDGKIGGVEKRLDGKIGGVEKRLEGKIDEVEKRLDGKLDFRFDSFKEYFDMRLKQTENRLQEDLGGRIDALSGQMRIMKEGLVEMIERGLGMHGATEERLANHERRITALEARSN